MAVCRRPPRSLAIVDLWWLFWCTYNSIYSPRDVNCSILLEVSLSWTPAQISVSDRRDEYRYHWSCHFSKACAGAGGLQCNSSYWIGIKFGGLLLSSCGNGHAESFFYFQDYSNTDVLFFDCFERRQGVQSHRQYQQHRISV